MSSLPGSSRNYETKPTSHLLSAEVISVLRRLLGSKTAGWNAVGIGRANSLHEPSAAELFLQVCSEAEKRTAAPGDERRDALAATGRRRVSKTWGMARL